MKQHVFLIGLFVLSFVNFVPSYALTDVRLADGQLTVVIDKTSLKDCLNQVGKQGQFPVTVLDLQSLEEEIVSQDFRDIPVEEGLGRLLAGWNYGLRKSTDGEHIQELFVVSKRRPPGNLPALVQSTTSRLVSLTKVQDVDDWDRSSTINIAEQEQNTESYLEEEIDETLPGEQDQPDLSFFPDDLPQDMREAIRHGLGR